jgi:hypothetical protein
MPLIMKSLNLLALVAGIAIVQAKGGKGDQGGGSKIFDHGVTIYTASDLDVKPILDPKVDPPKRVSWGGKGGLVYHLDFDLKDGPNTYHRDDFEVILNGGNDAIPVSLTYHLCQI